MKTIILQTLARLTKSSRIPLAENLALLGVGSFSSRCIRSALRFADASAWSVQQKGSTPDPGPLPATNTADGHLALASLTTGAYNSAFGIYSLLSLTDGNFCTGVGAGALLSNTASENTALARGRF